MICSSSFSTSWVLTPIYFMHMPWTSCMSLLLQQTMETSTFFNLLAVALRVDLQKSFCSLKQSFRVLIEL